MSAVPEAFTPRARRDVPRRYPALGFGLLAVFVLLTYGIEIRKYGVSGLSQHNRSESESSAEEAAPAPALTLDAAFVQTARALRGVDCLESAKLPLDPPCRAEATSAIHHFTQLVKAQLVPHGGHLSGQPRVLRPMAIQLNQMTVAILPKVQAEAHMDRAADLSVNEFAKTAQRYVSQVDNAFHLDDPKWKSLTDDSPAEPAPAPAAALAPATPLTTGEASAPEKTENPTKKSDDDEKAVHDLTLINDLVTGVAEVHEIFTGAGHDEAKVLDAIHQSGPKLEKIDGNLQRYRSAPHGDDAAQQRAQSFVTLVDQARGHILRAKLELQRATSVEGEEADGPFRAADELLVKAGDDVRAAREAAKTAP